MRTKEGVKMPRRATRGSAGYDFFAPEDIVIKAGEWTQVDTGVFLSKGDRVNCRIYQDCSNPHFVKDVGGTLANWVFMLKPKSGLAFKYGVRLLGGVVDMDYVKESDEIRAKMTADVDIVIKKGEKFMQGILQPYGTFADEIEPT